MKKGGLVGFIFEQSQEERGRFFFFFFPTRTCTCLLLFVECVHAVKTVT